MARKGETVHLRCEADGDQPMDVTWKAKGSRIESDYEMRYVTLYFLYVSTVIYLTITRHRNAGAVFTIIPALSLFVMH